MDATVFLMILFPFAPFVLYYFMKWIWRSLWRRAMIPLPLATTIRTGNQLFQVTMALFFIGVLIADYRAQEYLGITNTCFWLCYFLWPLSSAIYENSQKTNREFAIYWSAVVCITPVLYYCFAVHAE